MADLVAMTVGAVIGFLVSIPLTEGQEGPVVVLVTLLGAGSAWRLLRTIRLGRRVADLEQALDAADERWRQDSVALARRMAAFSAAAVREERPAPVGPSASKTQAAAPVVAPPVERPITPPAVEPRIPPRPTEVAEPPPAPPSEPAVDKVSPAAVLTRWLFGGNTIVKVGVGLLFIGLAFLAKLASPFVPSEVRLIGVAGAALTLLVVGWRLRERRAAYAHVLQGGAVAVLYLTLFVAFRFTGFYGPLPAGPVFGLLVAVAVLAAALAVLQDAAALAVIGALGGFAAPLLVSTGSGNQVALFSYYLVLDLGIAATAWHKTWRALNLVGFVFTFAVGTAWGVLRYDDARYASSQAFLAAFFLLFNGIMLMPARRLEAARPAGRAGAWVNGSLLFGLPTITFALQYGLVQDTQYGVALSALTLAAFYVLLAVWLRARPHIAAVVFEGSLAIGTVFITLTMPFALDARSTAGAWALEGAALVWLGFRQSRVLGRGFGYLLLAFAGLWLLVGTVVNSRTSAINATLLNGLLLAASSLAAAWCMQRFSRGILADPETGGAARWVAESLLIGWGTLWLGLVMLVEISEFVKDGYELAACLVCLAAAALVYSGLSVGLRWRRVSLPVIGYAPLLAACVWGLASEGLDPAAGGGWWGWPLALAAHLVVVRRVASEWPAWARELGHMLGVLVVAALGALQGRAVTADWGEAASAWPWLGWLVVPAGVLLSLLHPRLARSWPVNAAPWAYRTAACGVLTIGLLLWALVANWVSNGSASPLPHVPFMNPLDLGVGVAMLAAWRWRAGDGARAAPDLVARLVFVAIAIDGFIWLNAILIRAFHHWLGVPFRFDAWTASLAVQTGISLLWSVTALVLMWAATRRAVRTPWIAGAALLAAVVVKLLAVDLSGSGTVTRIVSFIGVGVLMLVIGYVAPLPGRGSTHDAP